MQIIQSGIASVKKEWMSRDGFILAAVGSTLPFEKIQGFSETWYRLYRSSGKYDALSSETFFDHFTIQKGTLK